MHIKLALKQSISFLSRIWSTTLLNHVYYKIFSIDIASQTIVLHVAHKRIFIKKTFSEIISDHMIIKGLSCQHACWLGVYYGRALRKALNGKAPLKNIKKPVYLLGHKYGRYKVISENRDGTITCLHVKTKEALDVSPITIAKDNAFLQYFDSTQACYIGILAGIIIEKNQLSTEKVIVTAQPPPFEKGGRFALANRGDFFQIPGLFLK